MKRVLLLAVLAVLGCSGKPHPAPGTPPSVDRAALEAALEGAWSFWQNNDMSTMTWTYALRAGTVDHSQTTAYVGTGRKEVTKLGAGTYTVTATGALSLRLATGHVLRFTAIITDGAICEAFNGHPCRTLGWNGFLAQDRDHTRYRRELEQDERNDRGAQFFRSVALIRFPRPLPALTSEDCSFDLEIFASAIVDGESTKPASGHYRMVCDIAPSARGPLTRVTVRGFTTDPYAWTNHVSLNRLVNNAHPRAQELFGRAFEPVLYFDPTAPDQLYVTIGAAYWSTP